MTTNLTGKWLEVFNDAVAEVESRSNIPSSEWKTAGRKTIARPDDC